MERGTIVRFDDVRGYGFIAPARGGDDVFVHANDFGDQRHTVAVGMKVSYEVVQSDRGLKVASVTLDAPPVSLGTASQAVPARAASSPVADDEFDVLTVGQFEASFTELLLANVPTMTGAQIVQARRALVAMARQHGWVED
ncbi:cold shock domain-containing protein [Micromonospora robiginosa]|uniref:Cold shock domain-containing protein n=1 Tax=Micromonospora robiginosa TaxID=2749844 RepID=A0A7L6B0L3_9ACTN|nr:cold shock domain-containing protein [Micromonospora ferruginea]QLQ35391.1 cold shock domain-containing protein [Micromonospora ferruginea]